MFEIPFIASLLIFGGEQLIAKPKGMKTILFAFFGASCFSCFSQLSELFFEFKTISLCVSNPKDTEKLELFARRWIFYVLDRFLSIL